jgi:hypothetical protein
MQGKTNPKKLLVISIFLAGMWCATAAGAVVYVDADASAGGDGTSWGTAYKYLQDGLADASSGDDIWVAEGTYKPDQGGGKTAGDRTATFQLKTEVGLYGGFAGNESSLEERDWKINETILSGDLDGNDVDVNDPADLVDEPTRGENSYYVVTGSGTGTNTILDGFTITAGNANVQGTNNAGAGMYNNNSSPIVANCTFRGNSADMAGSAMYNSYGSPTITNCTFTGNGAHQGSIYNYFSSPTMTNCRFIGNSNVWYGGGICNFYGNNPILTNCTFSGNHGMWGGGIYNYSTKATVTNCTFINNSAEYGGGMYNSVDSNTTVTNCILWSNTAPNGAQTYDSGTSSTTISYCDIQDGGGGTNISSDPIFVDANGPDNIPGTEDDNMRLLPGSPCIDAGDNNPVPLGVTSDPDGNPRFFDDPVTADTGNGTPPIVDIGAYEYYREAVRIYVDADASGANDGSSWADAYNYLQDALVAAIRDDEIWVAEGIYKPDEGGGKTPGDRTATFQLVKGVNIYGGFSGTETSLNERNWEDNKTILSGDLDGNDIPVDPCDLRNEPTRSENSYHVVKGGWTGPNTILDGLTISGGNADGGGAYNFGGGMVNDQNSPTMVNCTFRENYAHVDAGGIYNIVCNMTLTNCIFIRNSSGGHSGIGHGGGIGNFYAAQTLTNCTFNGNAARWGGGVYSTGGDTSAINCTFVDNSVSALGGGMFNSYGSLTITNCTFKDNSTNWGGGLYDQSDSNTIATNCTFSNNSAIEFGGGIFTSNNQSTFTNCTISSNSAASGGGIYNLSSLTLLNCTLSGNSSETGGGMYNYNSSPKLMNCTFAGNTASNGEALACDSYMQMYPSTVELANCILWDNGNEIWNNDDSTITINYSDVAGGHPGTGNIDSDPLFIGPIGLDGIPGTADDQGDNFHLKGYSPCINAGAPSGDYGGQVDLDLQPRIAYGRVDMGVDEVFPVAGDFEPDGDVDFGDFAIFSYNWLLGAE